MRIQKKTYSNPYDEIFEASLRTIKQLGWKLISHEKREGKIEAKTGTTLRSWGEDISIDVYQEATGSTISVLSEAHSQLFAWGKSEENEKLFHRELQRIISEMTL